MAARHPPGYSGFRGIGNAGDSFGFIVALGAVDAGRGIKVVDLVFDRISIGGDL